MSELDKIKRFGELKELSKELIPKYEPSHVPKFKTTEDLKKYLLTPSPKFISRLKIK